MPGSRYQDLLAAGLGLFCLVMLVVSPYEIDLDVPYPFYKGPLLVPMLALLLGFVAAIPAMWRLIKPVAGSAWVLDGGGFPKIPAKIFGLGCLYPLGIFWVGLELSTLVILFLALKVLCISKPSLLYGLPIFFSVFFWFIFKYLLDVYFPTPEIMYWLGG